MIRRNTSNARNYPETLTTAQLVGSKGIDVTKACDSKNTVVNMVNLEVAEDGGLQLRKPIIKGYSSPYEGKDGVKVIYYGQTFENTDISIAMKDGQSYMWLGTSTYTAKYKLKYTDYKGVVHNDDVSLKLLPNIDCTDAKVINTSTSTIITNVKVNLTAYNLVDPTLHKGSPLYGYRNLHLYVTGGTVKHTLEIVTPEMNILNTAESAVFNPNLSLDYTYALRDNYNGASVGVSSILAYAPVKVSEPNKKPTPVTGLNVWDSNMTVKQLTESMTGNTIGRIVTQVDSTTNNIILKAIVSVKPSDNTQYVCIWEKSYDGINWTNVNEMLGFFPGSDILIKVPEYSQSNVTLTETTNYVYKKCKKFNPKSSDDLVSNRPDCLKIFGTPDSATYRFTIYSLKCSVFSITKENTLTYDSIIAKVDNPNDIGVDLKNPNAPIVRTVKKNLNEEVTRAFDIILILRKNTGTLLDISTDDISVKVIYQDGTVFRSGQNLTLNTTHYIGDLNTNEQLRLKGSYDTHIFKNTFYNSVPTLIKIYYKGKLLLSIKELYTELNSLNNIQNSILYNPNDTYKDTDGITYAKISKTPQGINYIEPIPITLLPKIKTSIVPESNLVYENNRVYVQHVNVKQLYGDDFNETFVNSNLDKLPKLKYIFTDNLDSEVLKSNEELGSYNNFYNSIANSTDFKNGENVTLIYTLKHEHYLITDGFKYQIIVDPNEGTTDFSLFSVSDLYNFYYKVYSTEGLSQGLPKLYTTVEVTDVEAIDEEDYLKINLNLGYALYNFVIGGETEYLYSNTVNTALGEKLYYKKSLFTYGKDFGANIYPSDTDSFVTPLFNVIDLDTVGNSYVTTLVPWRNYLIAATENTVHLISKQDGGYYSKIINNFIGIPYADRRTCKAILNGIIFKSGTKIYTLQPNAYSSDDSILNIGEISKPIEGLIPPYTTDNFAYSTETAYYLYIPMKDYTLCFKYEYGKKVWCQFKYPVVFKDYGIKNLNYIYLYTTSRRYVFGDAVDNSKVRYGDRLEGPGDLNYETDPDSVVTPIEFYLNTGQKADVMSTTKQFVETKFVIATLNNKDQFPLEIDISIDGTLHPIHIDANTDSAFWKNSLNDVGTLTTNSTFNDTNSLNVLRQMFVRYSGKGKTIQHEIQGVSYFNFKIYMLYYRYRTLNIKQ